MDIIIKAGNRIMGPLDELAKRLDDGERVGTWRGKGEPNARDGDRVYLYRDGAVVGHCLYDGFEYQQGSNLQSSAQSGKAIMLKGQLCRFKPLTIPLPGPWLWRYVDRVPGLRHRMEVEWR